MTEAQWKHPAVEEEPRSLKVAGSNIFKLPKVKVLHMKNGTFQNDVFMALDYNYCVHHFNIDIGGLIHILLGTVSEYHPAEQ